MRNDVIICTVLLILFSSCTKNNQVVWDDKTVSLKGQVLDGPILDLYFPRDIIMIDSLIIVGDINQSELYHRYLIRDNSFEILPGFGKQGEGPGEFFMPLSLHYANKKLSIFNRGLLRYQVLNNHCLMSLTVNSCIETKVIKDAFAFNELIELDDNVFMGTGTFNTGMFAFYSNNSILNTDVSYPDDKLNTTNEQKGMVYQGFLAKQPNGKKVVYAGFYGQILEIFNVENQNIRRIFSDIADFPSYKPGMKSIDYLEANYTDDNKIGYFMTAVTDKSIYALYCGKTHKDDRLDYANIIFVFDWNGNRMKKYLLDKDLSCICVNNDESKIYGLHTDPEDDLVKFVSYDLEPFRK
ncbi:MAG: TolB-like 6-bladed beta-propeller domain-containing protein [Dysgonamonadaceae bacterium]|jgi:hypothetical protein|nr:TolB-like 6-bladed beta-propeller domain-containing protein [Dysgonamonadaceae bacterium]